MTVLADADARHRGLRDVITAHLPEELVMHSWVYRQGEQRGIEKGIEQGREQAAAALRSAIEKMLAPREVRVTAARSEQPATETRIEVLQEWLDHALTATRAADVFGQRAA